MYHSQVGMFAIPHLNTEQLARLHGMALGIPSIDDSEYKCEPIPGKLFTIPSDKALDLVLSQEGERDMRVIMSAWPAEWQRAGGGVDMRGGTRHATAQDRGIPDSDTSMG